MKSPLSFFSFLILFILYCKETLADVLLKADKGNNFQSLSLKNNSIFTFCEEGVIINSVSGVVFSLIIYPPERTSLYEVSQFTDGSIASYNSLHIYYFDSDGKEESKIQFDSSFEGRIEEYSITAVGKEHLLVFAIIIQQLNIALFKKHIKDFLWKSLISTYDLPYNAKCDKRGKQSGFMCVFIQQNRYHDLTFLFLDDIGQEDYKIDVPTISGKWIKMKKINNYIHMVCYLTYDSDIYCNSYDDNKDYMTDPSLIAKNSGNYERHQIDIGRLSAKEILLVYLYGSKTIYVQRMNYEGVPKGNKFTFQTDNQNQWLSIVNHISFNNKKHGIVYGFQNKSIYYKPIIIPYCYNYCDNIKKSEETIDLSLNSYGNSIIFQSLPTVIGISLEQDGNSIKTGKAYTNHVFKLKNWTLFSRIISFNFITSNDFGVESLPCKINLFINSQGNCECIDSYSFEGQCIKTCPDYAYSDEDAMACINCASMGQFLFQGECIDAKDVPENTFIYNKDYNALKECNPNCKTCTIKAEQCTACVPHAPDCPIKCPEYSFLSRLDGICKKCYETCNSCSMEGDSNYHNCLTCKPEYDMQPSFKCEKGCASDPKSLWFLNDDNSFQCITSKTCPEHRPIYVAKNNQCVESCLKSSTCIVCQTTINRMLNYNNTCVKECPLGTSPNLKENTCDKIPDIEINITDKPIEDIIDDLNKTDLDKPNVTIIKGDNYTVEIYNSTNSGGNLALSQINFGDCEQILRKKYNISPLEILIFVKFDLDRVNSTTDQIEYEVRDSKGNKLNLSYCQDVTIDITYQIKNTTEFDIETAKIFEKLGIDVYDSQDPFFTDLCYPFVTENGTDIIMRDRLKDIYKNISVCEESCTYKSIDLENLTVTCSCSVKSEVNTDVNMNFFTQSFTSVFTDSNFMVFTCYNLVFNSKILLHNYGFWFFLSFLILHIPNWFYYFITGISPVTRFFAEKAPKPAPTKKKEEYTERGLNENYKKNSSFFRDNNEPNVKIGNSQMILSQSKSILNINQPTKIDQKKSLFTTQKEEVPTPQNQYEDNQTIEEIIIVNSNNRNINQTINSNHYGNQSRKDAECISLYSNNIFYDNKPKDLDNCSIYSDKKEKDIFHRTSSKKGNLNNSGNFHNVNNCIRNNMTFNLPNQTKNSFFSNKKPNIETDLNEKAKLTTSKFHQKKGVSSSLGGMVTHSDTAINTISKFNDFSKTSLNIKPSKEMLDDFTLHQARKYDTRSFWRLYYICLKGRHHILSTFIRNYPFTLRCIIIITFLFGNILDFAFNALFFTEDLVSKRYNYDGNLGYLFTLQNNFVSSLASFVVSAILGCILNLLSTSESKLEIVFNSPDKTTQPTKKQLKKILKCLKIKLVFFLILELLFTLFFWYYVIAFCAVYQSSQWSWLSSGLTTFGLGLLFPFPISLAIVLVRALAIKYDLNWMYKLANWCYKM